MSFGKFQKRGVGKIGRVVIKRGVSLIFILTNPFQCYISLSVWFVCVRVCVCVCVCVFCLFTPFVSVLFMLHLVFLHLINRYL